MNEIKFEIPSAGPGVTMRDMLGPVMEQLKSFLVQYGCENKDAILEKYDVAIDMIAAIDIPQIPIFLEAMLDKFFVEAAKKAGRNLAEKVCA